MRISQFQKYSQKENTVTNNVLLMLLRLNDIKTEYYKDLIQTINESEDYFPSPIFGQQIGVQGGIIDGYIEVKASEIIIETKLSNKELIEKLTKYATKFSTHSQNYLWHISTKKYNLEEEKEIKERLKELHPEKNIHFNNVTFSDVVENLEQIYKSNKHNEDLKLLFEDFNNYCNEARLMPDDQYKLIFVPTGFSFDWNFKNKIYFCPKNWHKQEFTYFGLYHKKTVKTIATVENCIVADFDTTQNQLTIHHSTMDREITEKQIERLKNALIEWGDNQNGLKYYLFDENDFFETNFCKHSKGGIQGHRYKNLRGFIENERIKNKTTKEISDLLKSKVWD